MKRSVFTIQPFSRLAALGALLLLVPLSAQAGWQWSNPTPHGNDSRVCFLDDNTGYAVGGAGMILKTTDGGTTWASQNSGTFIGLWSVHFPVNAQTGYAVGGYWFINEGPAVYVILKTTDGGTTWASKASGTGLRLWSVHFPVDAQTGYAAGDSGMVLKTTDGGSIWTTQFSRVFDPLSSVHFLDAQTGFVGGVLSPIQKTTNGGQSWRFVSDPSTRAASIHFPDAQTGYAAGYYGVLKTTDGGESWSMLSGLGGHSNSVHFPNAQTGYVVGGDNSLIETIWKTTNGGATWVEQDTSGTDLQFYSVHFPVNAQTGYATGQLGGMKKTMDGGSTWVSLSSRVPIPPGDLKAVHFPVDARTGSAVTGNLYSSSSIIKTSDGGSTWFEKFFKPDDDLYSVHFPNAQTGYAVGFSVTIPGGRSMILRTTDGGSTWSEYISAETYALNSVHFPVDAQTGYAVGGAAKVYKTTDAGETWSMIRPPGTTHNLYSVHFPVDAQTGYSVGGMTSKSVIEKTTDGGTTWIVQKDESGWPLYSVHFPADAQTGYAVGGWDALNGSTIWKTTSGGANWARQNPGTSGRLNSVRFPVNDQTGYAVGSGGAIQMSRLGLTLKTTNGGTDWQSQISGAAQILSGVSFPPGDDRNGYIVGECCIILKTMDGGGSFVAEERTETPASRFGLSLKVLPNPFTSFARVPGCEGKRFALYDITGRKVGTYKGDRIGEGLRAGVYFLRPEEKNARPVRVVKVR